MPQYRKQPGPITHELVFAGANSVEEMISMLFADVLVVEIIDD